MSGAGAGAGAAQVHQISLEQEYAKPTGITRQDIASFRRWLDTQPHLPGELITELELILTYHCCGRSSEVSKQVLDLHFTLRTLFTSFFKDRYVDQRIERVLSCMLITPLETRTKEGYAVLYTCFLHSDSKNFTLADACRTGLMILDVWQREEGTWPGFMLIFDFEKMVFGHFAKLDLISLQQYFYYLQEAMLVNLKGIHVLNAPSFMDKILMMIRPFLKKELYDNLHIHQPGSREVGKAYPLEGLPKDTNGGCYKSVEELKEQMAKKIHENADFFAEENKRRVAEARRPGRPKTISDIFGGVEGSFKRLDID